MEAEETTRVEISKKVLAKALEAYDGPTTSAPAFLTWMLERFTQANFSAMHANCRPPKPLDDEAGGEK